MTINELLDALGDVPVEFERDANAATRAINSARHPCEEGAAVLKAARLLRRVRRVAAATI